MEKAYRSVWTQRPSHYQIIDWEKKSIPKEPVPKKPYMRINEHMHCGQEDGWNQGPLYFRSMLMKAPDGMYVGGPSAENQPLMRKYFVEAGRWDKKYLDLSLMPPLTYDDLIYHMDDSGIDMAVLVGRDYQIPWPPYTHYNLTADYVARIIDKYPKRFIGTAGITPYEMNVAHRIPYYVEDLHLKAVGEIYGPSGINFDDRERMYPIYEKCVEYDIVVFIHTGTYGHPLLSRPVKSGNYPYGNPRALEQVVLDFPEIKIMTHNLPGTRELVKRFPKNICTQVGSWARWIEDPIRGAAAKEHILWCQENIPDNCMYATDYPYSFPENVCVLWIEKMPELTEEFKRKIFETNVRRWYKF